MRCVPLLAAILLVACVSSNPISKPTDWPTLVPSSGFPNASAAPISTPKLIDHFRVKLTSGTLAAFPIYGSASVPERIEAVVLSGNIDPVLYLSNIRGERLAEASAGAALVPEILGQFEFPFDSFYELEVGSADGSGEVGVSIYQTYSSTGNGGEFESTNQVIKGSIGAPASYQKYGIPLAVGQRVDIRAHSFVSSMPIQLQLFAPNGDVKNAAIDQTPDGPAIWNFLADQTGTYTLLVNNVGDAVGDYDVELSPSESAGAAIVGARTILALHDKPRQSVWLTLDGSAYDGIQLEVRAMDPAVDPVVSIYDQFGHRLTSVDSAGAGGDESLDLVQFPTSGKYQVEFLTKAGEGNIQYYIRPVRLVDAKIGGRIYPRGRAEDGEIFGPGTVIVYYFDAQAGALIGIDAHSTDGSGLDLGFDLFAPDGSKLVMRDDDIGKDPVLDRITLPQTGTYSIALWNYGNTAGPYEIYVTVPEAPSSQP